MFLSGDVTKSCGFTSGCQSAASAQTGQTAHLGMGIAVYWALGIVGIKGTFADAIVSI